mgnify:CR=1 FL=1
MRLLSFRHQFCAQSNFEYIVLICSLKYSRTTLRFNLNVGVYNRESMARIFVTEDRQAEAAQLIEEFTGVAPRHRKI